MRILYSFAHKIGAGRICNTAWQQVVGVSRAGIKMQVSAGSIARPFGNEVKLQTTLSYAGMRLPIRLIGRQIACSLHDRRTASWLDRNHRGIDAVHGWPLSSRKTFRVAREHGIPCLLERPNAHTAFAYEVVAEENRNVGIRLPPNHDHQYNKKVLEHEEQEYAEADYLLCPSDFVRQTFLDRGFEEDRLLVHQYGFDEKRFFVGNQDPVKGKPITMLYAGVCEPRKGLHYALEAWLSSGAQRQGTFLICGAFVPGFEARLSSMLTHPSVKVLGHRDDVPNLMRQSDVFVLPSIEEGSALVTYEARASGCVLLVSTASGARCHHLKDALVHTARDKTTLSQQIATLDNDRKLCAHLRSTSLATIGDLTWSAAGIRLAGLYERVINEVRGNKRIISKRSRKM